MLKSDLEKLICSLSASEKKNFRIYCNDLMGSKDYLFLFELFCDPLLRKNDSIEAAFKKQLPSASFQNTLTYLFKVLTDMLVQIRINQDKWFARHHGIMKARLCFERSLPERGNKELKRVQTQAAKSQDYLMEYLSSRMELTQIADTGFPGINEQELVDLQMKGDQTLQILRQLHGHCSLYELLSHRLLNDGLAMARNDKQKLNDLVLSELSVITRGSQHRFETKKLHLLFQSFFFIHTGEYDAALKIFTELNELIESNESIRNFPPYDYLSVLEGILNSLRSINYYEEMDYFIQKTEQLSSQPYPEHFLNLAMQTGSLYRINMYIGKSEHQNAIRYFESIKRNFLQKEIMINSEKHMELLFFAGLAYFKEMNWKNANKYISLAIEVGKNNHGFVIYRACRMLYLVIHSELGDMEFLNYEIRTYKRIFQKHPQGMLLEKILLATISFDFKKSSSAKKALLWKKISHRIGNKPKDDYEEQLIKYFNFFNWIIYKLS